MLWYTCQELNSQKGDIKMKLKKLLCVVLAFAAVALVGCTSNNNDSQETTTTVAQAQTEITVLATFKDKSTKTFTIKTGKDNLGDALVEAGVASGDSGEYGLFITTVDGQIADVASEEWWKLTKAGVDLQTGASQTPIANGDTYEITLTVGNDM